MKIGIMGGTFNPIHIGHLKLAYTAYKEAMLDQVMFLPSGKSYMKDCTEIVSSGHRLNMVNLAIMEEPAFFSSDMEIRRAGNTYTCDTLLALKQDNPIHEYYFIMGADSLFSIERWKDPRIIFENCTILAAVRDALNIEEMQKQCMYLKQKFDARIQLLHFPKTDISSTEIRERIERGESVKDLIPEPVAEYIKKNALYQTSKE